jgi:hypothetical protein|tara:strand:+ start:396 stop:767 length:372 start_codon:yes stop_codon:yes gene_type:complete
MTELCIILALALFLSLGINILFVFYARSTLSKVETIYTASETASEIFTMLDAYEAHLRSVYEMPLFYGDDTLQGLLEHTDQLSSYIKQYEGVYSFTQPDLEEQLSLISTDPSDGNEEEAHQEE